MTRLLQYTIWGLIVFLGYVFITQANAGVVYYKQPGKFEQCKSAAGAYKYVCITGTGCTPNTLVCVPPSVTPPPPPPKPTCTQYQTYNATTNTCDPIPCGTGFTGNQPNCVAIPVVVTPPTTSLMPFVDTTKNVTPAVGYNSLRIWPTSEVAAASDSGSFRVSCGISHMNNDDPMVFPNQQNATHHHTYYGNTSVKFDTDLNNLPNQGNSTCNGGIMNRSAYWHPSLIDTVTNKPLIPDWNEAGFYYKTGYGMLPTSIKPAPKGLRMLAGNPKATSADQAQAVQYVCMSPTTGNSEGRPWQKSIPNCQVGQYMLIQVIFPQCWDGINLDSPNHKDHMAYPVASKCPATHPVAIPEITLNMRFTIKVANEAAKWRLASDNYAWNGTNAGYSGHADWVNGWDEPTMAGFVRNCLNTSKDCKAYLLGDGRMFN